MLTIPFGHTIDAVAAVLGEPTVLSASLATRRASVADTEGGGTLPMNAADQDDMEAGTRTRSRTSTTPYAHETLQAVLNHAGEPRGTNGA